MSNPTTEGRPKLDLVTEVSKFLHYYGYTTVPDSILQLLPSGMAGELCAATEALAAADKAQHLQLVDGGAL